jgi:hypothetical protein
LVVLLVLMAVPESGSVQAQNGDLLCDDAQISAAIADAQAGLTAATALTGAAALEQIRQVEATLATLYFSCQTAVDEGQRTNPVPLNTFYQFDNGQVRIAGVVDPYTPTDQYSTVEAGMRIVALDIEYQCQTEDPNESCSWMDVMAGALVSDSGAVNDETSWFNMEPNKFTEQEAYSGNTLRGYLFLQVPVDEVVSLIRMIVSFDQVFFLAQ